MTAKSAARKVAILLVFGVAGALWLWHEDRAERAEAERLRKLDSEGEGAPWD